MSYSNEPPQNQQEENNSGNHNEKKTTTTIVEHRSAADETSRLASKRNLSHIDSNANYDVKYYRSKRQVSKEFSQLGNKNLRRSRRSIPSLKNRRRSRRQVSYGGSQRYSTLESIQPSSLQKLREGYKENLREITLQPNEDPAEALMRLNSQSIQEALYRANTEPIEVDGTPGQTVVHNEGAGQAIVHNQGPGQATSRLSVSSNNLHSYQNQWQSQSPPMMYNNGNSDSNQTEQIQTVSSVYQNQRALGGQYGNSAQQNVGTVSEGGAYGVQHYGYPEQRYGNVAQQNLGTVSQGGVYGLQNYGNAEQKYGNGAQQNIGSVSQGATYGVQNYGNPEQTYGNGAQQTIGTVTQGRAGGTTLYGRPIISPPSMALHQSLTPRYATQFRNTVLQPNIPVVNNPSYFYQQPNVAQVLHQVPSAPIGNFNQLSAVRPEYAAPMLYSNPLTETAEATVRDYLGGQLIDPPTDSFNDLMETIKDKLTNCCHKCKKQILKGINSGIGSKDEQNDGDDPDECLSCKASSEFLSDLKSLQNNFMKNTPPKTTSRSNINNENTQNVQSSRAHKSDNTFRYYRDPNAINRQKPTQGMAPKKSRAEDDKEKVRYRLNDKNYDDLDYDYNLEGDYNRDQKTQSHRSNQETNAKRLNTSPAPRDYQDNDQLHRSGYSYKSKPQTSKSENNRSPNSRSGPLPNLEQQYSDDYEKRRPHETPGYKRVADAQGRRRLTTSRSGPKESRTSGYDYEKQAKNESSNKNNGYNYTTTTTPRVRKQKYKQEQSNESQYKTIQKQLKELESKAENLENDDAKQQDILEKKTKLIELLYFLYEMSKCSMGEQCPAKTTEQNETSTVPSIAKDSSTSDTPPTMTRRVKIPRKKEVKTIDYSTIKEADNSKNSSDGKKVRSVDNYYEEDW